MNKELLNLSSGCQRSSLLDYFFGMAGDIHWPGLKMYCKVDWVTVSIDRIESRQKKSKKCWERKQQGPLHALQWAQWHNGNPVTSWQTKGGGEVSEGLQRMLKCRWEGILDTSRKDLTVHIGYIDNYCHPICRQNFNLKQVFVIVKREDATLLPSLKWLDQPVP